MSRNREWHVDVSIHGEPMADSTSDLTTDDIVEYVGETYAGRGQNYFYDDRIVAPKIHGGSISAKCMGSKPEPYEVKIGFRGDEIRWSTCSCPVPEPCKHVAALLFTYIETPESFQHPERLKRQLHEWSTSDLVDLLMEIADRDPDLERFLERRVFSTDDRDDAIDRAEVRSLAERAFVAGFDRAGGTGLEGAVSGIVEELRRLDKLGDDRADDDNYEGALAVWTPLAEVVLDHLDRSGAAAARLRKRLADLEDKIARHLPAIDDESTRESALACLWQLYCVDLARGGGELGDTLRSVLAESASADERRRFADLARGRLETLADSDGDPAPDEIIELVDFLDEVGQGPPGERVLGLLDQLEPGPEIVEALLAMGEPEAAKERAQAIEISYEFGEALDAFVEAGHPEWAETLARERLEGSGGGEVAHAPGVQEWLVRHYDEQDRPEAALDLMCRIFEQHPSRERYHEIERLADRVDQSGAYISTARSILRNEAPREYLRLALEEGAVELAVDLWREIEGDWTPRTWKTSDLELELAGAVESTHPRIAADIYAAEADMLAESGGRDSYRRAVDLLERCERLLGTEHWAALRDGFVEEHGSKRSLIEAMESAGLVSEG